MFVFPELVIESVIRDGLANLRKNKAAVDRIFAQLAEPYLDAKYGQREINRIRKLIDTKEISVVHNLSDVEAKSPAFSIQLGMDVEDQKLALLGDHDGTVSEDITDPDELAALIKLEDGVIQAYDQASGEAQFSLDTDLSEVSKGNVLHDASGTEWTVQQVVSTDDQRSVFLAKGSDVDYSDFVSIKSSITTHQYEERSIRSDEQVIVGVHAKDALTCKYLYVLLKFFMNSRRGTLVERGLIVSSFHGSDFTKNLQYMGDQAYNRFYTVTGKIEDRWRDSEGQQIENVTVRVKVERDSASSEDLDLLDSSVSPSDEE